MKRRTAYRTKDLVGLFTLLAMAAGCMRQSEQPAEASSPKTSPGVPAAAEPAAAGAPSRAGSALDDAAQAAPAAAGKSSLQVPGAPQVLDAGVDLTKHEHYPGAATQMPDQPAPAATTPEATLPGATTQAANPADQEPVQSGPVGPQPRMSLVDGEEETAHFGEVKQGTKASHTFHLLSDGDQALVITRIKPSCGCTAADLNLVNDDGTRTVYTIGQPIAPGTKFEIEASVVTEGRQGPMSTYVTIFSNEAKGFMNLHLEADVVPVLLVQPGSTLNLGAITSADEAKGELTVTSTLLDPYVLTVDQQFVVPPLSVQATPVDPTPEGKAKTWKLEVKLGPDIPEGLRNYPLRLMTDVPVPDPKVPAPDGQATMYEARAFVQAQVTGLVSAEPNFLSFGMVRPGQVVERTVKVRCLDDFSLSPDVPITLTGLRGEEFPYKDSFSWKLVKLDDGTMDFNLKLEGMPEDLNGSFGGVISIQVGHPQKPDLQIRFSGVCRQGLPPARPNPPTPVTPPASGGGEAHH